MLIQMAGNLLPRAGMAATAVPNTAFMEVPTALKEEDVITQIRTILNLGPRDKNHPRARDSDSMMGPAQMAVMNLNSTSSQYQTTHDKKAEVYGPDQF